LEGIQSAAFELNPGDLVDFGIDIISPDGLQVMYRKVSCRISFEFGGIVTQGDISAQPAQPVLVGEKASIVKRESLPDIDRLDVCFFLANHWFRRRLKRVKRL
jgi:hypothetical protein